MVARVLSKKIKRILFCKCHKYVYGNFAPVLLYKITESTIYSFISNVA